MPLKWPAINKNRKWFPIIHEVSKDIISTVGLDDCLEAILNKTVQFLGVEMASVMLINRKKNELSIRYARGLSKKIIKEAKSILGQDPPREVAVWVVQKGEPLLIRDIEKDGRFLRRNGKKYSTKSLLSVPLVVKGQVIGVLNVNNKKNKTVFSSDDLNFLTTLANEVSAAVQYNRIYEELRQANEELKELDQLKSDFVANVSHELNTPLATSRYLLAAIEKGTAGNITRKQKEYILMIENNIDRLTRLIGNLLNLSRLEAGRFELKKGPVDLAALTKEAVAPFKLRPEAGAVSLKIAVPSGLPRIYVDRDKIIQVFVNLLDNAIKFTEKGGKIAVSAEAPDDNAPEDSRFKFIKICVSDTGRGIPAGEADKLFTKFQRVPQKLNGKKVKGTGLGLAISREIIDRHGGKIWVESKEAEGSRFFFTLPAY